MSREILFRGKRVDNGEWIEGSFVKYTDYDGDKVYLIYASNGNPNNIIPETVGQFTGLTDKNGKKIFEGDIVKVSYIEKRDYQGIKYDDESERIETVVYNEKTACFMLEIDNEGITMFRPLHDFGNNVFIKSIEVIGNIFDNPELLGE